MTLSDIPEKPTVALVGAGSIGRHHARWWHLSGAHVVANAGSSIASATVAGQRLTDDFGYRGIAYDSVEAMLDEQKPDWVDICTPDPFHAEFTRLALERGIATLCEKPLIYHPQQTPTLHMYQLVRRPSNRSL